MKLRTVVLIALMLLAIISAYAKVIPSRPFFLDRDVSINGAAVPPGLYSLTVEAKVCPCALTLWD